MDKLNMHPTNLVDKNIKTIAKLFPNAITEVIRDGKTEIAIDFDVLKQELSTTIVEGNEERYQFTWPDKKKSVLLANAPNYKTLRPCREESVNFDTTENLYIEGDNLDVLKLLQETYLGKVKMIYIDPPYNTGKDFVYADDFKQSVDEYMDLTEQYDEEGNRLFTNSETNGRYHTDWLNMIYPRLRLAKDLLKDDGVIFISIDDNEVENLKKVCNEVFGAWNFVACIVWQRNYAPISLKKYFSESHEFLLCYAKKKELSKINLLPRTDKQNKDYKNPDNDSRGVWKVGNLTVGPAVEKQVYEIVGPTGKSFFPPKGYCWRFRQEKLEEMRNDNRIWFGENGENSPVPKLFLSEVQDGVTPMTLWTFQEAGHNQDATREVRGMFDEAVFTSPKPLKYMKRILHLGMDNNDLILDFFSGSATTAHAVMQLNAEDGGNRKFIMVQLPEAINEKHEACKAGYRTICDIGKERIRRAGKQIVGNALMRSDNQPNKLDIGFRVLKCDSTNMKDVYYYPEDVKQQQIDMFVSNIKKDRTPEDLLFQVMLDLGVFLSNKIEVETIDGKKVFVVEQGGMPYLIACFDEKVTSEVVTTIAKRKPYYAVFRDSSMENDSLMTSFEQIFEAYSKGTIRRVI